MSQRPQRRFVLSYSQKFSRLALRLKDPEWRHYGRTLLMGKALGVASVLLAIGVISTVVFGKVFAADAEVKAADVINPINTLWTLVAAFLVFGMQVGFTMLEAGFCRSRETVNVLMECIVDTCLCGLLFLRHWLRFHVQPRQRFHWLPLVLPARRSGNIRVHRSSVPRILALPVCIRRYLLHHHIGSHDRTYRLCRRPSLQPWRFRIHVSNHWSLGLGTGWIPRADGQ